MVVLAVRFFKQVVKLEVLRFSSVSKRFGDREVLKDISLNLQEGECIALLGPNGAGKSTIIQLALGLMSPTNGQIQLLSASSHLDAHEARYLVGVVPQYDSLDPDFTVEENLRVFGTYFGVPKPQLLERTEELLEFAALNSRRTESVSVLSGGMRRRLTLARALINKPKLLFLDEPTTALDPQAKHLMWERLIQLKRAGLSLFLTTHYMDEAQRLADRVIVIDRGVIVAQGSPVELIDQFVRGPVLEIWGMQAQHWVARLLDSDSPPMQRGETFYLFGDTARRFLDRLTALKPEGVEYLFRPSNLEDVFFHLTGRDLRDD